MLPLPLIAPVVAAALAAETAAPAAGVVEEDLAQIAAVPQKIEQIPFIQHVTTVVPAADVVLGATVLVVIMLVHAVGVRWVTNHVAKRSHRIMERPAAWRADALMSDSVLMLLALHLFEIFVWTSALVYAGLVPDWRTAGFFAASTYTTVGYGKFVLPPQWAMLAPIISISGLFGFAWSGSVLVDIVRRCQRVKDAILIARRKANAPLTLSQELRAAVRRKPKAPPK